MAETIVDGEIIEDEGTLVPVDQTSLGTIVRAEIDQQVTTAKQYPRSISRSKANALTLATLDEETAGTMFYRLPRGGKHIIGESIRLAEVIASTWGNLRLASRVVNVDRKNGVITARGGCHDLETNNSATIEVDRRITDKHGNIFNADMIVVTGNAACSIALRNAIFRVIPKALIKPIFEAAKRCYLGDAKSHAAKRDTALDYFRKAGADDAMVFDFLGVQGLDDIKEDQLIELRGLFNAVHSGEASIESIFESAKTDEGKKKLRKSTSKLNKTAEKQADKPAEPASEIDKLPPTFAAKIKAAGVTTFADVLAKFAAGEYLGLEGTEVDETQLCIAELKGK